MRIADFRATAFSQLEKKLSDLSWELFLPPGTVPHVHVTAKRSRLIHSKAIAERVRNNAVKRLKEMGATSIEGDSRLFSRIFVRVEQDRFIISLDSSGNHLYKRGVKKHVGKAPIRDTLAAAALLLFGYTGREPLVDPMCGSGTFSLEAAMMAEHIPPGWFRSFAFMEWPAFVKKRYEYMRNDVEKRVLSLNQPSIFASDTDEKACFLLNQTVTAFDLADAVRVSNQDFFETSPKMFTKVPGFVVINPPYGRRIGTGKEKDLMMEEICKKLKADYRGWKVLLITPNRLESFNKMGPSKYHRFIHGGLRLYMAMGRVL
jgi:putative N6-adenine-specific DNA methylase